MQISSTLTHGRLEAPLYRLHARGSYLKDLYTSSSCRMFERTSHQLPQRMLSWSWSWQQHRALTTEARTGKAIVMCL